MGLPLIAGAGITDLGGPFQTCVLMFKVDEDLVHEKRRLDTDTVYLTTPQHFPYGEYYSNVS